MKKNLILSVTISFILSSTVFSLAGDWDTTTNPPAIFYDGGNVGIGTSSPNDRLEVNGKLRIDSDFSVSGGGLTLGDYTSGGYKWIQSFESQPLYINPLGNNLILNRDGGNVGIGTTSPGTTLHIWKNSNEPFIRLDQDSKTYSLGFVAGGKFAITYDTGGLIPLVIDNSGNVGVGTTCPASSFHLMSDSGFRVEGSIESQRIEIVPVAGHRRLTYIGGPGDTFNIEASGVGSTGAIGLDVGGTDMMTIKGSGNVGIGTTSPDYKLDVKGTIRAEEVKVETGWSDFVFEDDYALPSLDKVESFIKENKHLPDIPSEKEIKENGLSMADMMAKQMKKIEELTLYIIAQNKKIENMEKKLTENNKSEKTF